MSRFSNPIDYHNNILQIVLTSVFALLKKYLHDEKIITSSNANLMPSQSFQQIQQNQTLYHTFVKSRDFKII